MLRNIVRNSLKQQTRRQVLNTSTRALAPSISILNRVNSCTLAAPTQRQFNTSSIHWNKDSNENTKYTITYVSIQKVFGNLLLRDTNSFCSELTTDRYHKLSDEILDFMCAKLEELADEIDMKGFDVEYNQGVMTISVGQHGTYVINKQPPNHQIWLSSPVR